MARLATLVRALVDGRVLCASVKESTRAAVPSLLGADFRDLNLRLARSLHEDLKGMASIQTDERW